MRFFKYFLGEDLDRCTCSLIPDPYAYCPEHSDIYAAIQRETDERIREAQEIEQKAESALRIERAIDEAWERNRT